jgi:hypothetical protein
VPHGPVVDALLDRGFAVNGGEISGQ